MAYQACILDVKKALEGVAPGATVLSDSLDAQAVAGVAELVAGAVADKDSPLLAAARMQVVMEAAFMQQRELLSREAAEKEERIGMLLRGARDDGAGKSCPCSLVGKGGRDA